MSAVNRVIDHLLILKLRLINLILFRSEKESFERRLNIFLKSNEARMILSLSKPPAAFVKHP